MDGNNFKDIAEYLKQQSHIVTSNDGLITVVFSGDGSYQSFRINKDQLLYEDIRTLEKDIMEVINRSKEQMGADLLSTMNTDLAAPLFETFSNDDGKEKDEDEDVRSDVS